jgi:TRAP-type C4-dicarboxylate transport system substrate-binding protein
VKQFVLILLVVILAAGLLLSGCPAPAPEEEVPPPEEEPIELTWVTILEPAMPEFKNLEEKFFDRVEERAGGELVFKFVGGQEVFSPTEVGPAVQKGVVDIGQVFVGAYEGIVPGVSAAYLREVTLDEERKPGGAYDYLLEMHKKAGLYYLGRPWPMDVETGYFNVWLNKKVERPEDLVGLSIGGTAAARAAVDSWGATWVNVGIPEYYSALEHGVVDGITAVPPTGHIAFGTYEVTEYGIAHAYYDCSLALFMNLDTFNRLPPHLQNLLTETFIEAEKDLEAVATGLVGEAWQWLVDEGHIEPIIFSPADAERFVQAPHDAAWKYQEERFPEVTAELKKLLTK